MPRTAPRAPFFVDFTGGQWYNEAFRAATGRTGSRGGRKGTNLQTQNKVGGMIGGLAVGTLAVATFAWGLHLGPERHAGQDLFRSQTHGLRTAEAPSGRSIVLASSRTGAARVADTGTGGSAADDTQALDDLNGSSPASTFQQVYYLLKRNYADGIPEDATLAHGAASAMLTSLQDPQSRFLEPAEFAESKRQAQGRYDGIGAVLAVRTLFTPKAADDPTRDKDHLDNVSYQLTILEPLPGGPAEKAGLKTGDIITDVDGKWIQTYDLVSAQYKELKALQDKNDTPGLNKVVETIQKKLDTALTLSQAQTRLSDSTVKSLALTVSRPGQATPLNVTLDTSAPTTVEAVTSKSLSGSIGEIKINLLNADTAAAFDSALSGFGTDLKGLVLDLRGATGSDQAAAAAVAARLSSVKTLGSRVTKGQKVTPIAVSPASTVTCPVSVLVNGGTANAAELLAAALQSGGAKLIGAPTFGDDMDVRTIALRDGSGFTLTVGRLLLASGAKFTTGVKPDILTPESPGTDAPLSRAVLELSGRVARVPAQ